jgi:hypothetical protein
MRARQRNVPAVPGDPAPLTHVLGRNEQHAVDRDVRGVEQGDHIVLTRDIRLEPDAVEFPIRCPDAAQR